MANQNEKERFGRRLRSEREKAKVTLTKLAEHLGISIPYLSDIERGNRAPFDNAKILAAADLLNIHSKELLREAAVSRGVIELNANVPPKQREVAAMLMRGWNDLTDDQLNKIESALHRTGEDDDYE